MHSLLITFYNHKKLTDDAWSNKKWLEWTLHRTLCLISIKAETFSTNFFFTWKICWMQLFFLCWMQLTIIILALISHCHTVEFTDCDNEQNMKIKLKWLLEGPVALQLLSHFLQKNWCLDKKFCAKLCMGNTVKIVRKINLI